MLNSDEKILLDTEVRSSPTVSIILSTSNFGSPSFLHPKRIKSLIPKGISSEIILVRYKQDAAIRLQDRKNGPKYTNNSRSDILQISSHESDKIIGESIRGNFTTAIKRGLELSTGQFIVIIDVDFPYPEELIPKLIAELVKFPNSIVVASKHSKGNQYKDYP